mmetsp:Transcript_13391/g.19156  ORF Transcript_13391/g.19156 Transcript_13391/m.19156 type:complete len:167 (-) Transcript_13391:99-599(-)
MEANNQSLLPSSSSSSSLSNHIWVCNNTHHPSLYCDELYVKQQDMNWIGGKCNSTNTMMERCSSYVPPLPLNNGGTMRALCRTRHLQPLIPCCITWNAQELKYTVRFDKPIRAVTPGQIVAIYIANGIICLGGGLIWAHGPTYHKMNKILPKSLHPAGSNDLSVNQ